MVGRGGKYCRSVVPRGGREYGLLWFWLVVVVPLPLQTLSEHFLNERFADTS